MDFDDEEFGFKEEDKDEQKVCINGVDFQKFMTTNWKLARK